MDKERRNLKTILKALLRGERFEPKTELGIDPVEERRANAEVEAEIAEIKAVGRMNEKAR